MCKLSILGWWKALLVCVGVLLVAACSKNDEETAKTSHAFISSVTLGQVKRTLVVNGVVTHSTFTATDVKMSIDQRNRVIENKDSLLYGSNLDAALLNISFTGSYLAYRPADDKSAAWKAFSSTDSIDLRKPIELCVNASDSKSGTNYILKVNVHQQEGDSVTWVKYDPVPDMQDMTELCAAYADSTLYVLGRNASGIHTFARGRDNIWTHRSCELPTTVRINSLRGTDLKLYACTSNTLYTSQDGVKWQALGPSLADMQLVAVTDDYVYAIAGTTTRTIQRLNDMTLCWEPDTLSPGDSQLLPETVVAGITYEQDNDTHYISMIGESLTQSTDYYFVWNKLWNDLLTQKESPWMYFNPDDSNLRRCPRLASMCLLPYGNVVVALGGQSPTKPETYKALDRLYYSYDHGVTWYTNSQLHLPFEAVGAEGPVAAAVDGAYYIWLITRNNVWRGRLNRMGFKKT